MPSPVALRSSDIRKRLRDTKDIGLCHKKSTKTENGQKKERKQVKKAKLAPGEEYKTNDIRHHFKASLCQENVLPCSSNSLPKDKLKDDDDFPANYNFKPAVENQTQLTNGYCTPVMDSSRNAFFVSDMQNEHRRKFYIVQKGGSPAEMYCTDLVHKAKHGHRRRRIKESRLMKCTDKWREEWNHGVQMPLSRERPTYCYDFVPPFPRVKVNSFHVLQKYIALNEKKYTKKDDCRFDCKCRMPLYQYEVDSADESWLASKDGKHISKDAFLRVMDQLEIDCYMNIHLTILEQLTFIRDNAKADDDADCDVCCMPEWEPGDEIVFCDNCNISVHQSCYGLNSLPTDDWMCSTCLYRLSLSRTPKKIIPLPPCIFCPILGGAMKSTKNAKLWAHVVCALWIPEVRFGDVERREPISHISDVPADRWKAKCVVCDTSNGACIRCTYAGCNTPFHVSCAQRSGLVLQIEQSASAANGVRMTSYCSKHSFLSPCKTSMLSRRSSNNFSEFDRNQLDEMKQNFSKQVDLNKISSATGVSEKVVQDIYTYWHWKRKLNSSQPLIAEPPEIKLLVQPKQHHTTKLGAKARQKNNLFNNVPSEELLDGFEKIRQIRLNLEKVRNLCYMVSRREKLKKAQMETFERVNSTMGGLLLDPLIPCSKRRTEKLLDVWESTNKEIFLSDEDFQVISKYANSIVSNVNSSVLSDRSEEKPTISTHNKQSRKTSLVEEVDAEQAIHNKEVSSATSMNVLPSNDVSSRCTRISEEQKRRDDPYIFRSSSSPHYLNDVLKNSRCSSVAVEDFDKDNISDTSNYSEYSVAWSNSSENDGNGSLFNLENAISTVTLKNAKKKNQPKVKNVNNINGVLKMKKVNFKEDRRKSNLNGWKNNVNEYVLHHPELRDLKSTKKSSKRNY